MQNDIPAPGNPFVVHFLLSPEWVKCGREAADLTLGLWSSLVAKNTGALSQSGRVDSALGGQKMDRIVFDVSVGHDLPRGGYGASHEFGIGIHPDSRVPPTPWMPQAAVDDLVRVLAILDSM